MEDDVVFINNIQEFFSNTYKQVPSDWSMLYFCGNHINTPKKISASIGKISRTYTTNAYAVTKKICDAAAKMLEQLKYPADVTYAKIHNGGNCYSYVPGIALQRSGYSDIQKDFRDYTGIIT